MLPPDWLQQIREAYPKRIGGQGWGHVKKRVPALIKVGESFDDMLEGCEGYSRMLKDTGKYGTEFVMQARTFFGPGEWWLETYDLLARDYVKTLDEKASDVGLVRSDGEPDESLQKRIGIAQTKAIYSAGSR